MRKEDACFEVDFKLTATKNDYVHALVGFCAQSCMWPVAINLRQALLSAPH